MQHLYSLEDLTEINVSPIKATGEMCDEEGISFLLRTYNSRIFKGAVNGGAKWVPPGGYRDNPKHRAPPHRKRTSFTPPNGPILLRR